MLRILAECLSKSKVVTYMILKSSRRIKHAYIIVNRMKHGRVPSMKINIVAVWEMEELIQKEKVHIIDIRSKEEYKRGHIPGAVCAPFVDGRQKIKYNKNDLYLLYCDKGNASMQLAKRLGEMEYRVCTLCGGYEGYKAWNKMVKK